MATEVNKILLDIEIDSKGVISNLDQVQSKLKGLGVDMDKTGKQFSNFGKAAKDGASAAGIAGAAAAELGRTISDIPFGLTAITNNVSQLGSMFSLLVVKTGTVKKALGELLDVFKGPAGYLIVFQIAVAAVELFAQRQNKAKKEVDQLNLELEAQAEVLKEIIRLKKEGAITSDDEERLLNNYVKINKELVKLSKEGVISEKEKSDILKEYLTLFELTRADDKAQLDRDAQRKVLSEEIVKLEEKRKSIAKDLNNDIRINAVGQFEIEAIQRRINGITEEIRLKESQILDISFNEADKKSEIGAIEDEINKKIDDAIRKKERLLDIEKERAGALSALLGAEETQEERLVSESILEQDEKAFREHFKRLSQIRGMQLFNQREQELKDVQDPTIINAIEERYRLLFAKLNNEISNAFRNGLRQVGTDLNKVDLTLKEVGTTLDQLAEGRSILLSLGFDFDSATDLLVEAGEESVKEFQKRQSSQGERNFFVDTFGVSEENLKAGIEAAQTALNTLGDVFSAQAEREIAVETNRTNQLNDQLKQRLANEQLSADERDKINQEIARNEAQLVAKENQINKKRFEQEKAVNIALATVNTFSAATGVLAETKGGTFARIAGMIAVIGAGLAQVAIIAKQQFTAKAMPSPNLSGLGGAGGGGAEPQFNVIGATGQNQLAAAIAATQQQPVKAYVVSNDVTTAQSLDRNIVAEASL
jgi:hypothetical protein